MEALYATHGFPRDAKHTQYRPPVSVLSSPSARSLSSTGSQDDLLPELWLETPSLETPALQPGFSFGPGNYANPRVNYQPVQFQPNFTTGSAYYPGLDGPGAMHGSLLLRDESLEYAQSLLPNSLLFPLASGLSCDEHNVNPQRTDLPMDGSVNVPSNANSGYSCEDHCEPRRNSFGTAHTVKSRQGSASSLGSVGSGASACSKTCKNLNTQLYKTELCASFMKLGLCPYGGKCQFAHGRAELKTVDRPSNWRSKPCTNWARTGSCRYGKRCCFKHGE